MSDEQAGLEPGASTRRRVLAGAGMTGAAVVLGACGTEPTSTYEVPAPPPPPATSPPAGETEAPDDSQDSRDDAAQVDALASVNDVEVGGGLVLAEEDVVITHPADGVWNGFSATCTHQGCTLASVANGTINCDCHGSQFSIEDGSVVTAAYGGDPSQQDPLPAVEIAVDGEQIVRA